MKSSWVKAVRRAGLAVLRDERGAMWPFAVTTILVLVMGVGMGLNIMRFETERMRAQTVADTAALAAASMGQNLDPTTVVQDYFDKAGLGDRPQNIEVVSGLNGKRVTIDTETETDAFFANYFGIESMRMTGRSSAEEARTNVEVVLVLDISGSMRSNNRLANLKVAATDFVNELLDSDINPDGSNANRISIAIVPYNSQVNLGPHLFDRIASTYGMADNVHGRRSETAPFGLANDQTVLQNARCVEVPTAQMTQTAFSTNPGLSRTPFTDIYTWYSAQWSYVHYTATHVRHFLSSGEYLNRTCYNDTRMHIRLPTNNRQSLLTYINNLFAIGGTSIDLGLRWGGWMLDPQAQPIMSQLVHNGSRVSSHFSNRPVAWNDRETMKVVVLMTDGQHFQYERVNPGFASGNPPNGEIRYVNDNGVLRYTIRHTNVSGNQFWVPHLGQWQSNWWRGQWNNLTLSAPVPMERMLNDYLLQWVAWEFYGRAFNWGYWQAVDHLRTTTLPQTMDQRLLSLCSEIKQKNAIIFGVAFEAPPNGAQVIESCASPDRYYATHGANLTEAFRQIRGQIVTLRLTQ